jgi:hypothetical protein
VNFDRGGPPVPLAHRDRVTFPRARSDCVSRHAVESRSVALQGIASAESSTSKNQGLVDCQGKLRLGATLRVDAVIVWLRDNQERRLLARTTSELGACGARPVTDRKARSGPVSTWTFISPTEPRMLRSFAVIPSRTSWQSA